ncbi:unnamed protein product [Clonostachys rosea]|uniref:F-box domain-containing protein n=1 Tax=Bionectria ochroleuca TaxID=29856 RepID=A0ABY6TZM1_BIOOC|nr:unnamed protein product [Clonostachys rosea]
METTGNQNHLSRPVSAHAASHSLIRARRGTRIPDYFKPDRPSKRGPVSGTSFLDLPPHIRDRIYEEAGFRGNEFIDLNLWMARDSNLCWKDDDGPSSNNDDWTEPLWCGPISRSWRCPYNRTPFPAALLWAGSRLVHHELEAKIYSQNTFAISLVGHQGLRPLEMLSDAALRELRVLYVSICPCECLTPYCDGLGEGHDCYQFHDRPGRWEFWKSTEILDGDFAHSRPLDCISRTDKRSLSQWERICARLKANTRPNQLSLYLAANVANPQTANRMLDPLNGLPILKDLGINLGHHLNGFQKFEPKLLVRQVVQKLTDTVLDKQFPFFDLPLELQIKIIQQTGMADYRYGRVHWYASWPHWPRNDIKNCYGKEHPGWISAVVEDGEYCPDEVLNEVEPLASLTAFCSLENPAAFSNLCECTPESTLFQVSDAFSVATRAVFFTENAIWLHPSRNRLQHVATSRYTPYPLALPSFLHFIPHKYIPSLRSLCVIFPPFAPDYLAPGQSDWDEWASSVELLVQLADLTRLRLEIHFSDQEVEPYIEGTAHGNSDQLQLTLQSHRTRIYGDAEAEAAMLDAYKRILGPLKSMGPKLKALLVYASWPLRDSAKEQRKADERMLERMIMGQEYDSAKFGKRVSSPWSQPRDHPPPFSY